MIQSQRFDEFILKRHIEKAHQSIGTNQLMIVSCVGTQLKSRSLIDDFVFCAQKAMEVGTKAIELNYSCPNIFSKGGSIYQDPFLSRSRSDGVLRYHCHLIS